MLSLRCGVLWDGHRPADPDKFLAQLPEELKRLRNLGASLVEFKAEVCSFDGRYRDAEVWARAADCVWSSGLVGSTVHLPAVWVDLAALDHTVWEGSILSVEGALVATAPLRPVLVAVHPASDATGEWIRSLPESDRQPAMLMAAERVIDGLLRIRQLPEAQPLALENLEGAGCDLISTVAGRAGTDICLDIGHVVSNGERLEEALDLVALRLRGIHLHDAKPPAVAGRKGQAHLPLGSGALNLPSFLSALRHKRFSGPIVLEVRGDASESARRYLDIARRAM